MRSALTLVLALLLTDPVAAAEWRSPVAGAVARPFVTAAAPFARGQHRGVDLRTRAGQPVRAACTGHVRFAGRLPRGGGGVSIECGGLVATHLGLSGLTVARGALVRRGARIGAATGLTVHLGARRVGRRHGYLDPLMLIGEGAGPGLGPAPAPRAPGARRGPAPPTAGPPPPLRQPRQAPIPFVVWTGMALLAAGTPLGALAHRRTRRTRARARIARPAGVA